MGEGTHLDFCGVIAVAATPFTDDDRIDTESLRRYVRFGLQNGIKAILTPAFAGEVESLNEEERKLVVETVVDEAAGRVPIVGGASAPDQEGRLRHTDSLIAAGCDAILAFVPFENEDDYRREVSEIAIRVPSEFVLQDQDSTGSGAPVPVIAKLFSELDTFTSIKVEVSGRCRKISELREATASRLCVWTAGPQMLEALDRGVDGYAPTVMHDVYAAIMRMHRQGMRDEAKQLYYRFVPVMAYQTLAFQKRLLMRQGVFTSDRSRTGNPPKDHHEERMMEDLLEYSLKLSAGAMIP